MKVYKYYTPWQVTRMRAKGSKELWRKLDYMRLFLNNEPTINNLERVLNWASGLNLYIKSETVEDFKKEISRGSYTDQPDKFYSLSVFERRDLGSLFKDLKKRALRWASNHYYNKDLLSYLQQLADHLDEDISDLIKRSQTDENKSSHKFLF